jgi:hypothetical protein
MTPVPFEKVGVKSTEFPLVTMLAEAVSAVTVGSGTAVTVKGAEIEVPA